MVWLSLMKLALLSLAIRSSFLGTHDTVLIVGNAPFLINAPLLTNKTSQLTREMPFHIRESDCVSINPVRVADEEPFVPRRRLE